MNFFASIKKFTFLLACAVTLGAPASQVRAGDSIKKKIIFVRNKGIYAMDPNGSQQTCLIKNFDGFDPNISPNGRRIVFSSNRDAGEVFSAATRSQEIYSMNIDGSKLKRLTHLRYTADADYPVFSPDGKLVACTGGTAPSLATSIPPYEL